MKELRVQWLGRREYLATVALQEELVRQRRAGEIPDTLLLLEHEAVITVGRAYPASLRSAPLPALAGERLGEGDVNGYVNGNADCHEESRDALPLPQETRSVSGEGSLRSSGGGPPYDNGSSPLPLSRRPSVSARDTAAGSGEGNGGVPPIPVVETSRGGQATYHGPGQLVAYPIVDLRQWRTDLHWYLRQLEAAGIETLRRLGLSAGNRPGHTGVWIEERKIASIGVAVRGWVTYHGLALNVACDMAGFADFDPCGLPSEVMVSLRELGVEATVIAVAAAFAQAFQQTMGYGRLNTLPETPEDFLRLTDVSTTIRGR